MQALDLIRELQNKYPIARARMRLRFVVPTNQVDQLSTALNSWNSQIEGREEMTTTTSLVFLLISVNFLLVPFL
jgi:hypothetical protein